MGIEQSLAFPNQVRVTRGPADDIRLEGPYQSLSVPSEAVALRALVERILAGTATRKALFPDDGLDAVARAERLHYLDMLNRSALLDAVFEDDTGSVLRLHSQAPAALRPLWYDDGPLRQGSIRLSPRALMRWVEGGLRLESPFTGRFVTIGDPASVALLDDLAKGAMIDALAESHPTDLVRAMLHVLDALHLVDGQAETGPFWEFHDLLFHARSRMGRHLDGYGGTFRLRGKAAPLPAIRPRPEGAPPAIALREAPDSAFAALLSRRRSTREFAERPLSLAQLGELLDRCARATAPRQVGEIEVDRRPYPTGGAAYDLEVYVLARRVEGLEPGLYHHAPRSHTLDRMAADPNMLETMARHAARTYLAETPPQAVLLITSRLGRVAWKYASMSYALVLKHVGVLYQTLYLSAADLGLGACALGGGNSDLFAEATGIDCYAEPLVGEFVIGRPADADDATDRR